MKDKGQWKEQRSEKTATKSPLSSLSLSPIQQVCNALVANFWIGPLVVMYWVSVWNLSDSTLSFLDNIHVSTWVSAAIGFSIKCIWFCFRKPLQKLSNTYRSMIGTFFLTRFHTYTMAFASVCEWRSVWYAWDVYTSKTIENALATMLSSCFVLILLRFSKQGLAVPAIVSIDVPLNSYFESTTYFGTEDDSEIAIFGEKSASSSETSSLIGETKNKCQMCPCQYIADMLFTVTVVPVVTVTTWRGFWTVLNRVLEPHDPTASAIYCLVIAYGLEGLLLLTRVPWRKLSALSCQRHWLLKYLVEDTHTFLHLIATITFWRGFWLLYEMDFMDSQEKFWIGHAISFVLLAVSFASSSTMARGCRKDGEESNGQGIELDMYCVTHLWKFWKKTRGGSIKSKIASVTTKV